MNKTRETAKMIAALIVIAIGMCCWWWLSYEGYTKPTQRVILVTE